MAFVGHTGRGASPAALRNRSMGIPRQALKNSNQRLSQPSPDLKLCILITATAKHMVRTPQTPQEESTRRSRGPWSPQELKQNVAWEGQKQRATQHEPPLIKSHVLQYPFVTFRGSRSGAGCVLVEVDSTAMQAGVCFGQRVCKNVCACARTPIAYCSATGVFVVAFGSLNPLSERGQLCTLIRLWVRQFEWPLPLAFAWVPDRHNTECRARAPLATCPIAVCVSVCVRMQVCRRVCMRACVGLAKSRSGAEIPVRFASYVQFLCVGEQDSAKCTERDSGNGR